MKQNLINENRKYDLYFLLIIIANILIYFIIHPRMVLSDDYVYAKNAFDIFNGTFKMSAQHFYNRFGVFVPVGIMYKLFGINDYTTTLWPFIMNILTIGTSYYFVKKNFNKEIALICAFLIGFNFSQINWGLELAPDIIMSYFACLSAFLLYEPRLNKKNEILYGALFVLFLFFAFLAKENIITILPFLLILFIYDLVKKQNIKFWLFAVSFGAVILVVYFSFYQILTGDFYYRFNGIENSHNLNIESYVGKPVLLMQRLLYLPVLMFINNIYYYIMIALSIPVIYSFLKKNRSPDNLYTYWILYTLVLFFSFWFGSTSLKHYNPFTHMMDRTWMMLLVPLSILSSVFLYNFIRETDFKKIFRLSSFFILFFSTALILNIFLGNGKKVFVWILLILFFFAVALISYKKTSLKIFNFRYLFFVIILIITVGFSYSTVKFYNYVELKKVFNTFLRPDNNSKTLVITSSRIADDHDFFYKFRVPAAYSFVDWEKLNDLTDNNFSAIYVLIDEVQIVSLVDKYGRYLPKFISNIPSGWKRIYYNKKVSLYKINSLEDFKLHY